jgi:formate hydrogenlyase subunit 3/multisubunit Na+/H+ antiporter MnhD subunit
MIWLASVLAPLVAACALASSRTRSLAERFLVPYAALPALLVALFADADASARFDWLLLGVQLGFGEGGRVMLSFTALLWSVAGAYAGSYFAGDLRRTRFMLFFALTMCGNLGLVAALDIVSFYMFFALMTFSAYGLIVHNGDAQAYRAGRIYLYAAIFGEMLLLAALMLTATGMETVLLADARASVAASSHRDLIVLLAFCGFGVKAGAVLVHFWLPLAHPVAPVPASAVLSGAMIKAGLLGWLYFLPFGQGDFAAWGAVLVTAGYLAAFGGAAIGLAQREAKTVLAYSSVSQMGIITAVLGTALADARLWPLAAPAVAIFAFNHALAKGGLFLGVGVAQHVAGARPPALVLAGLALGALAIAGAPWTAGALAKHAAKVPLGALEAGYAGLLPLLMSLASVATTMLLTHFLVRVMREAAADAHLGTGMVVAWALLVFCTVFAVPAIGYFAIELNGAAEDVWTALWPIAVGGAAYAASIRLRTCFAIPPGDIVVLLERAARSLRAAAARVPVPGPAAWQINFVHYLEELAATEARRDLSRRIELRLTRWNNAALAFAGVVLALAMLVML